MSIMFRSFFCWADVWVLVDQSVHLRNEHRQTFCKMKLILHEYPKTCSQHCTTRQKWSVQCTLRKKAADLQKNDFYWTQAVELLRISLTFNNRRNFCTSICATVKWTNLFNCQYLDTSKWICPEFCLLEMLLTPTDISATHAVHVLDISIEFSIATRIEMDIHYMF